VSADKGVAPQLARLTRRYAALSCQVWAGFREREREREIVRKPCPYFLSPPPAAGLFLIALLVAVYFSLLWLAWFLLHLQNCNNILCQPLKD